MLGVHVCNSLGALTMLDKPRFVGKL